ncbi:MAG: class I SAM-dependent rRNA methyltransferase [Verrucomicrobia subdivision 3 bacterium]|nr:class I SAM-dependent rRNA methyltransferase [Limisphaerales bacterium]
METLPTVVLRPGEADRVIAGHPWIYAGSVLRVTAPAADGAIVQVKDHRQRFLGTGFFNSRSKIRVRMLSRERVSADYQFFHERIEAALALRRKHMPTATSFRVVNAESDFLSGLIVDKYEDVLVLQTSALGMDQRKDVIVSVLQALFAPRAMVERSDSASRKFEGLAESNGLLMGALAGSVPVRLNGLVFETNLTSGHKTGMYLDQQLNYQLVSKCAAGAQVLDCFSFAGGFALHAARAGAAHVHAVDQSEEAIAQAQQNAVANGLAERCSFETANVFDWFKARTVTAPHEKLIPRFDLIILDPPSFTRSRAAVPDALRGYKEIHLRALKLLKPGGTLATFCCSHHVDANLFQDVINAAAYDAKRVLRRTAIYTQSPDHPVLLAVPETEYLKGFAFEVAQQF